MQRVYNFSAGPATLPTEVMQQAQQELLNWEKTGASVMEVSHRGKEFVQLAEESVQDLRDILNLSDQYEVLFLQGGARAQFAMIPMNLLEGLKKASYVVTGLWGEMALKEAERYGEIEIAASSESTKFTTIPPEKEWKVSSDSSYLHYTDNETINGVEFSSVPENISAPLVCDMSSNILSRPIDVSKFGLIYASAQKNIGPAGITLVIIRKDLLKRQPLSFTPSMFRYQAHVEQESMLNTPPTFSWYMSHLVFKWIKRQGGLSALAKVNQEKADKLYQFIDHCDFYTNTVDVRYRSRMNVVFKTPSAELDEKFVREAAANGMTGLKGHRYVGGIRASIYNAMPLSGVTHLVDFMKDFVHKNG
jgi:phosphoserine aminotransferase